MSPGPIAVLALFAALAGGCTVSVPSRSEFACRQGGSCDPVSREDAAPAGDGSGAADSGSEDDAAELADGGATDLRSHFDATNSNDGSFMGDATSLDADLGGRDAGRRDGASGDGSSGDGSSGDGSTGDGGCAASEIMCAGGCHPADECTACTTDANCPSGQCHPVLHRCVPAGRLGPCEPCTRDLQCGLAEDTCVVLHDSNNNTLESVCGRFCGSDVDCPRGYSCNANVSQCYPRPGSLYTHTCAAFSDMLAGRACNSSAMTDQCGIPNFDDGVCLFLFEMCVVGCDTMNDCPEGSTCTDIAMTGFKYCLRN